MPTSSSSARSIPGCWLARGRTTLDSARYSTGINLVAEQFGAPKLDGNARKSTHATAAKDFGASRWPIIYSACPTEGYKQILQVSDKEPAQWADHIEFIERATVRNR